MASRQHASRGRLLPQLPLLLLLPPCLRAPAVGTVRQPATCELAGLATQALAAAPCTLPPVPPGCGNPQAQPPAPRQAAAGCRSGPYQLPLPQAACTSRAAQLPGSRLCRPQLTDGPGGSAGQGWHQRPLECCSSALQRWLLVAAAALQAAASAACVRLPRLRGKRSSGCGRQAQSVVGWGACLMQPGSADPGRHAQGSPPVATR
jgi:hypothetical protein